MGSGIAQIAATAGANVTLFDKRIESLERSRRQLKKRLGKLQEKGRLSPVEGQGIVSRMAYTTNLNDIAGSNLVIESIVEDRAAKQAIFGKLESIVDKECILATNTSSLSVTDIAAACRLHPERVIGIHFFIPAQQIKLVEIIPGLQTSPEITDQANVIIKQWGKTTVLTADTPGFLVNRIARPYYLESIRMVDQGVANIATIDWAMTELGGFRMGPFALMDYIGNDINYTFTESLFEATYFDDRYRPSGTQRKYVQAGYLGRKTGRGFYNYFDHSTNPAPNKDEDLGRSILLRVLVLLINEAADALFWNRATKEDIDLAMTTGIRFPNGLLAWADDLGISFCVKKLDELHNQFREERYKCSPLLRKMQKRGERFY